MKLKEFNAWVRMKNARNNLVSCYNQQSLYINTTNVGPVLYLVPLRQKESVNAPVKGVRKPKRKFKDDDEEDKDVVRVDES